MTNRTRRLGYTLTFTALVAGWRLFAPSGIADRPAGAGAAGGAPAPVLAAGAATASAGPPIPAAATDPARDDATLSPYFVVLGGVEDVDRLPLRETSVDVSIAGVIADVTVRQTWENAGARPIDATYVFPASTRAAVHGLTLSVGEERIRARIREREQARREFERAKREKKTASLLEQERPNVFRMSLSNVLPGDRIEVELRYSEVLAPEAGIYEFVYPTVVGPRYSSSPAATAPESERWVASPYTEEGVEPTYTLDLAARVAAGVPIDALDSPSHRIQARWQDPRRVLVDLDPAEARGGDRDFVLRYRLRGEQVQSGLLLHRGDSDGDHGDQESFFLLTVQPPRRVVPEDVPRREVVFVIDVSGSMNGFPLDTARHLIRTLVGDLQPADSFNMLFFAGGSHVLSPASLPATPGNLARALEALDSQRGGGGTELLSALKRSMALPAREGTARSLVVVTDGFIRAERAVFEHVRGHLEEANVFAFGIGSSVNRYLIEGLAKAGLGEPFTVLSPSQSREVADRFREYVSAPVLTDVRVDFDGFQADAVEPESIPDVLADRPLLVYGKWTGEPVGRIVVRGVSGRGPWEHVVDVADTVPDAGNAALAWLWAKARVARISDFSFGRENDEERAEVVRLGLRYDLLTRFTSFIAVHEVVRPVDGPATDVQQPSPLPAGVSHLAVGGVAQGPEPPLLALLAALLAAAAWRWRARAHRGTA